jgi:hypothetical protein
MYEILRIRIFYNYLFYSMCLKTVIKIIYCTLNVMQFDACFVSRLVHIQSFFVLPVLINDVFITTQIV